MASQTSVSICNRALLLLGANPISSFADETVESRVCDTFYGPTRDSALVSFPWTWAEQEEFLAQLSVPESSEYEFSYSLPANFLHARYVVASDSKISSDYYKIADRILSTNEINIRLVYTYQAPEHYWGSLFQDALVFNLASLMAMPIREDGALMKAYMELAGMTFARARLIDSQQDSPSRLGVFPLIETRG